MKNEIILNPELVEAYTEWTLARDDAERALKNIRDSKTRALYRSLSRGEHLAISRMTREMEKNGAGKLELLNALKAA